MKTDRATITVLQRYCDRVAAAFEAGDQAEVKDAEALMVEAVMIACGYRWDGDKGKYERNT